VPVTSRSALAISAAALFTASPAGAAIARDGWDQHDVDVLRASAPQAADLLERGEALAAAGDYSSAETSFRQAEAAAPGSTLLRRRRCEALIPLGRRAEAVQECSVATSQLRTGTNVRALVRALVDGPTPPGPLQLFQSVAIVGIERSVAPGSPNAAAMLCDIAASTGDEAMLKRYADELERIAPNDPEITRAEALLASACPPARFWTGWLLIGLAAIGTVVHALRRRLLGRRRVAGAVAIATVLAALCTGERAARADDMPQPSSGWLSKWKVDDAHPEASIPDEKARNADPLQFGYWLQDLSLKAEWSSKHDHHEAAARYYAAMGIAVPDRAIPFSKLCDEYETMGDLKKATNACGDALSRSGVTLHDYAHFVHLVLDKAGAPTDKEASALTNVINQLKQDPAAKDVTADLECEVAARTGSVPMLRECTSALTLSAPNDPKTLRSRWVLAIQEHKFEEARDVIEQAGSLGMPTDAMVKATATDERRHRLRSILGILAVALLLGAAGVGGSAVARRRLSPKAA
jgi:tetratricopeptide (TPR) repeat protein